MSSLSVDQLIIALNDKDAEVREQACLILGYIKDSRSFEPLIKALKDDDSNVRRSDAIALGFLKDPRAVRALISVWSDTNSDVRTKASEALIAIGPAASEQLLLELKNKNSYIRWRAAWCLGRIKDQGIVKALTDLLNDSASEVRWIAIDALATIGNKSASEALAKLCHTEDEGIRAKVKVTLIELTGDNICK